MGRGKMIFVIGQPFSSMTEKEINLKKVKRKVAPVGPKLRARNLRATRKWTFKSVQNLTPINFKFWKNVRNKLIKTGIKNPSTIGKFCQWLSVASVPLIGLYRKKVCHNSNLYVLLNTNMAKKAKDLLINFRVILELEIIIILGF